MINPCIAKTKLHDHALALPPLPAGEKTLDRIEGALWGIAVGDALGYPYEGKTAPEIAADCPFLPEYRVAAQKEAGQAGMYSDDTQMSLDVARCLLLRGNVDPTELLSLAGSYRIRGVGPVVLLALYRFRFGDAWNDCGVYSPYNGGAMRAMPVGLYHGQDLQALFADAVVSCWATHTHPVAVAATFVMAYAAAYLSLCDPGCFDAAAFLHALTAAAGEVEHAMPLPPGTKSLESALKRIPAFLHAPLEGISVLGSSVHAAESVAAAVLCFLSAPDDFMGAVRTAVCGGGDTDSVASMAGGMCGALYGVRAIPAALRAGIFGYEGFARMVSRFARACIHG